MGIEITGLWLRSEGDDIIASVEIRGRWRRVITEHREGPMSHIAEVGGIRKAPLDTIQNGTE